MKLIEIADQRLKEPDHFEQQKLLSIAENELSEDHEVFKQLGLKNNEIEDTYRAREEAIVFNMNQKLYGRASYNFDQLTELCMAYNLRLLRSNLFKGKVPHNIVSEIKHFAAKHELNLTSAHSNQFYILGPEESFILEKVEKAPKDPVLLWRDGDHFIPITQWGGELTFMRYLNSIPKRTKSMRVLTNSLVAMFATFLVTVSFASVHWSLWISIPLIALLVAALSDNVLSDMRWRGTEDLWNHDSDRSVS